MRLYLAELGCYGRDPAGPFALRRVSGPTSLPWVSENVSLLGSSQIDPVVNKNSAYESCTWRSLVSPCLWWKRNNLLTKAGCERRTPMVEVKLDVSVRAVRYENISDADRIMRLAFGTFLGLPEPMTFMGDASYVRPRWLAA